MIFFYDKIKTFLSKNTHNLLLYSGQLETFSNCLYLMDHLMCAVKISLASLSHLSMLTLLQHSHPTILKSGNRASMSASNLDWLQMTHFCPF